MPKNINKAIKELPKAQRAKVEARAEELKAEVNAKQKAEASTFPKCVNIKRVYDTEESFSVVNCNYSIAELRVGLETGALNLIQSATVEPYVWIVDESGRRIGQLEKDGGSDSGPKVTIDIY
jgi:hypothetical protein